MQFGVTTEQQDVQLVSNFLINLDPKELSSLIEVPERLPIYTRESCGFHITCLADHVQLTVFGKQPK